MFILRDPFVRRVSLALTLTAAGVGVAPVVSDLGTHSTDGTATLVWLALALFGVCYGAVLAASVAWSLVARRRAGVVTIEPGALRPRAGEPDQL